MRHRSSRFGAVVAAIVVGALLPSGVGVAAAATPPCGQSSDYVVAQGVWLLGVTVTGASGGSASGPGAQAGGRGGKVSADLAVFPGQHLSLTEGCAGNGVNGGAGYGPGGNGTTDPLDGTTVSGGGGGGSVLMSGGRPLVVAGGGGGGGTNPAALPGGNGGNPAQATGTGGPNGGCGGCLPGTAGGNGAAGLFFLGGGGGGGNHGGGGGSATIGEGGGGGLSFADPSLTQVVHSVAASSGDGSISLTPMPSTFSYRFACGPDYKTQAAPDLGWPFLEMDMTLTGGSGGAQDGTPGGLGGSVTASMVIPAGTAVSVAAGCAGVPWAYKTAGAGAGGASAFGPGGKGGPSSYKWDADAEGGVGGFGGSGGGGASAVLVEGRPLVVAGGGGGSGGLYVNSHLIVQAPAAGGNGGNSPSSGGDCPAPGRCTGGRGGASASPAGAPGGTMTCNNRPASSGASGGGGGGLEGGGAGTWPSCGPLSAGPGGGGGLSYADPSVPAATFGTAATPGDGVVTVTFRPTTIDSSLTVSSSSAAPVFGATPTFTAKVSPGRPDGPQPTGTVQFSLDGVVLSSSPLDGSGTATSAAAPHLAAGPHSLVATYADGLVYHPVTITYGFTVAPAPPAIEVSYAPSPAQNGVGVQVSAHLAPAWAGGPLPGGMIQFAVDGQSLGSYQLISGAATSGTGEPLSYGAHTLTATYGGDGNYAAGATATTVFARDETLVSLDSSVDYDTVFPGNTLTFSTTVSPASQTGVTPTGTVTFSDAGAALAPPVALVAGTATTPPIDHAAMAGGHHTITATYSGDEHFMAGQATLVILVIALDQPPPPQPSCPAAVRDGLVRTETALVAAEGDLVAGLGPQAPAVAIVRATRQAVATRLRALCGQ